MLGRASAGYGKCRGHGRKRLALAEVSVKVLTRLRKSEKRAGYQREWWEKHELSDAMENVREAFTDCLYELRA